MHSYYEDIRSRIKEEPTWYDCNGVPRYGEFKPHDSPNIYANEVLLVQISCQDCRAKFLVEFNWDYTQGLFTGRHHESFTTVVNLWLKDAEKAKHYPPLHYGDPPAHGCVGDTMNCYDLKIVQFWRKGEKFDFVRVPELEVELVEDEK
jgi:hypothetical protein